MTALELRLANGANTGVWTVVCTRSRSRRVQEVLEHVLEPKDSQMPGRTDRAADRAWSADIGGGEL